MGKINNKKQKKNKKDLIPLVLYKLMYDKYMQVRNLQKELQEHLEENYKPFFLEKDSTFEEKVEELVCDSLYGDENEADVFIKKLNKILKRK